MHFKWIQCENRTQTRYRPLMASLIYLSLISADGCGPDAEVGGVTPLSKHHFMVVLCLSARSRATLLSVLSGLLSQEVVTGCSKVPLFFFLQLLLRDKTCHNNDTEQFEITYQVFFIWTLLNRQLCLKRMTLDQLQRDSSTFWQTRLFP